MTTVDNQNVETDEEYEDDYFTASCGCGFTVETNDAYRGRLALEDHNCSNRRWFEPIFSFWGVMVLFAIGWIIAAATGW